MTDAHAYTKVLGKTLRELRSAKNKSQEQLALDCGLNTNSIGLIERGQKCPTIYTLKRICDALDISLAELFAIAPQNNASAIRHVSDIMAKMSAKDAKHLAIIVDSIAHLGK
ncbi:MAG: helix-turn-helix transcriptional regulator [Ruthenibacterium sp.]